MKWLMAALILTLPVLAAAQSSTVWRCGADGRTYSDVPCDQGQKLALADSRPAADVEAARERAAQEQRAADRLLAERLQREAAARSMGIADSRPAAVKVSAKPPAKAKRKSNRPEDVGIFRAVAPTSPRKKG